MVLVDDGAGTAARGVQVISLRVTLRGELYGGGGDGCGGGDDDAGGGDGGDGDGGVGGSVGVGGLIAPAATRTGRSPGAYGTKAQARGRDTQAKQSKALHVAPRPLIRLSALLPLRLPAAPPPGRPSGSPGRSARWVSPRCTWFQFSANSVCAACLRACSGRGR
ncbi:hypothetical protein PLESTF_000152800 [Pleodorina starrii]|nr:hypothetical protein PLESTF_000152800 [Pleodorina starrii]